MNKKIAAIAVVLILIIVAAAVFIYEDGKADEKSLLAGEWKLASIGGVDSNGDYDFPLEKMDEAAKTLTISKVEEDLFVGEYAGKQLLGSCINGFITFKVYGDDGNYRYDGFFYNGILDLSIMHFGNDHKGIIYDVVFTRDGSYEAPAEYAALNGLDMILSSSTGSSQGKNIDLTGDQVQRLKITSQEKNVFKGTMDQVIEDRVVSLSFSGVLNPDDKQTVCTIMDETNNLWIMSLSKDKEYAVLNTHLDYPVEQYTNNKMAVESIFIKEGSSVPEIKTAAGLEGNWKLKSLHQMNINGEASENSRTYDISLLNAHNTVISGSYAMNEKPGYFASYAYSEISGDGFIVHATTLGLSNNTIMHQNGWISNDGKTLELSAILKSNGDRPETIVHAVYERDDGA